MTAITVFCEDRVKESSQDFRGKFRHVKYWSTRVLWIREVPSFVYAVATSCYNATAGRTVESESLRTRDVYTNYSKAYNRATHLGSGNLNGGS